MTNAPSPALPLSPPPARIEAARRALGLVFLANGALFATWAVNIPGVRDRLHLSEAEVGLAVLAIGLGSLPTMPLTGGWTARFGSHRVTQLGVVLCMLSLLLPFVAPSLGTLVVALALLGAANGALDVAMNAQGVTVERRIARPIMSRLHASFSLGGVLGALLGTLLVGRVPMLAHVGLVVVLTTLTGLWAGRQLLPDLPPSADETASASTMRGMGPAVLLLGALCFLGMLAEGANYDWAALYYRDVLGLSEGLSGIGYAAFVATMTLGRWFGDTLRQRLGDETTVRGGALLTALGLGVALLARDPLPVTLGFALSGLGLSNVVPVLYGVAGHALAGPGIARVATIGYTGFLLGPPAIGFIAQVVGLPAALGLALVGAALVALLGGPAFRMLRSRAA